MPYQFANAAHSTLAAGITAGETALALADGARFPATGDFPVLIYDPADEATFEIALATARATDTLTVVRGQEGTAAAAWSAGVAVAAVITQAELESFRDHTHAPAGGVATDAIWDAAGDLAVGSGANTAAKLAIGSALQQLRVNAGATALEWATPSGGGAWTQIAETIVGAGGATDITLSGIPGTYRNLVLTLMLRGTAAATGVNLHVQLNGDTGANYDWEIIQNLTASAASADTKGIPGAITGGSGVTSTATLLVLTLVDYARTVWRKDITVQSVYSPTVGAVYVQNGSIVWRSTAAVTSVTVFPASGNLDQDSIATLWGVA